MIRDSQNWNLYLAPDRDHIDILAYCSHGEQPLFTASVPLPDTEVTGYNNALQEAIYDNPLLLNDFNKITVINRDKHHTLIPNPIADTETASDILSELTGGTESGPCQVLTDKLPLLDITMCHSMDQEIYNFLRRTFNGVNFIHHLSVLTRYFHGTMRASGSRCSHVNVRDGELDIVIYSADTLLLANTYRWSEPTDALYFVMATRRCMGIDDHSAVILSGEREAREKLTPTLREYLPTVIPAIFPAAMFRNGGTKAMEAPNDLIYMPLCE